jgi:hypothetical protein
MSAASLKGMTTSDATSDRARGVLRQLLAHCRAENWAGYDPYDALNSRLFSAVPLLDHRLPRLVLTQALKRSPVNIRRFALVPKTQNPKGLALFLTALLKLRDGDIAERERLIDSLIGQLKALRSPNAPHWCWGYSFAWQTRTLVVPRGTPNLVCTVFVANALLDAYEQSGDASLLEIAKSAATYIASDLYAVEGDAVGFRYPTPQSFPGIHNANILGAAFLCRVYAQTRAEGLIDPAMRAARYSADRQQPDGSWVYGDLQTQQWVDNFHTGYNLSGLRAIGFHLNTSEFDDRIRRGFEFYHRHFFREDGAPRYFHDRTYPIDIHAVAQSLITLREFSYLDDRSSAQADAVFDWAIAHMWDERGYFYYRVLPWCVIRTSYMRWSQAWMCVALATFLESGKTAARMPAADNALHPVL